MPYQYGILNQPFIPAGQWPRDDSGDPSITNLPFSISPTLPSATAHGSTADAGGSSFGDDNPIVQAGFLRGPGVRPGFGPMPPVPPGPFDWQSQTEQAIMRLLNLFRKNGGGFGQSSSGDRNGPGCKEEWDEARQMCVDELSKPNPNRGITGGYRDVENCARGLVSERCGGNPVIR